MQLPLTLLQDGLLIGRHTIISFNRTLRIPEDGEQYDLPSGFGRLPILRVEDVADRVPAKWRKEGGLIIPLYQCEALFLELSGANWRPTIAKVAVGRINAINGKPHDFELKKGRQDYVVIPVQRWLDGINAGKGIVRQFVAMPLGQGYTVEAQVTDEETHGGFQIAVFDPKEDRFWESIATLQRRSSLRGSTDLHLEGVLKSQPTGQFDSQGPHQKQKNTFEMGIAAGGSIRQQIFEDEYGIDTWDPDVLGSLNIHIVNSEIYKELTGRSAPSSPITAKAYAQRQIPWYKHYEESRWSVSVPSIFKKLLTVGQIDKGRGAIAKSDVSFESAHVIAVKTPTLAERVNELRRSSLQSYTEYCYSECLTQSRMCGELIDYHLADLISTNQSKSPEQMASECFCIASECASRLGNLSLSEDLANRSLLIAFSEDALSVRLQARMMGGKIEEALDDCNELLRVNPSHNIAQKIKTLLAGTQSIAIPQASHEKHLGMKFVRVPGTDVLFSVWDTRVKDFAAFVEATNYDAGTEWKSPGFSQTSKDPVVYVSWDDAKAFCKWLTVKERGQGNIAASQEYRLPTDAEWSVAVGLPPESGNTPEEKDLRVKGVYPWGQQWPPPKGAGNYSPSWNVDSYEKTSPVGSFAANRFGLYDMGGNVWQWCEDLYSTEESTRVLRGGNWCFPSEELLLSSHRLARYPGARASFFGFRSVLVDAPLR